MSSSWFNASVTRNSIFGTAVIVVLLILVFLVGGYFYSLYLVRHSIGDRDERILQLQTAADNLTADIAKLNAELAKTQADLAKANTDLEAIVPRGTENTFNILPNQSIIVANGHLTLGLIGAPSNEAIVININGKQRPAAAGDIINVQLNSSTNCVVRVESFTIVQAVVNATCATAKPQ